MSEKRTYEIWLDDTCPFFFHSLDIVETSLIIPKFVYKTEEYCGKCNRQVLPIKEEDSMLPLCPICKTPTIIRDANPQKQKVHHQHRLEKKDVEAMMKNAKRTMKTIEVEEYNKDIDATILRKQTFPLSTWLRIRDITDYAEKTEDDYSIENFVISDDAKPKGRGKAKKKKTKPSRDEIAMKDTGEETKKESLPAEEYKKALE